MKKIIFTIFFLFSMNVLPSPSFAYNMEKVLYQAIEDKNKNQIDSLLQQGINLNEGNYLNNV
ncbi:MAG: hypothetical protein ACE5EK_11200, partial [Nitrospinales bacterium]